MPSPLTPPAPPTSGGKIPAKNKEKWYKRMIQGGRAQIRATLYMGAVVAMRHNPVIKTFYERLVGRGKSKKLALTACVRKILVILNAMVRQNQPWQLTDNLPPCS